MNIRQTIEDHKRATVAGVSLIVLLACFASYKVLRGNGAAYHPLSKKVFFSDDDGATWFADDITHIPPFDHDGKTAYRAMVFQTGEPSVGYLMKFDPDVKKLIEARLQVDPNTPLSDSTLGVFADASQIQVKAPRDPAAKWIAKSDPAARAVTDVKAPDGSRAAPIEP